MQNRVRCGNNGYSNRHNLTLRGYRILEAIKSLAEKPEPGLITKAIRANNIHDYLGKVGFEVKIAHVIYELNVLDTANYVSSSKSGTTYSYTLTKLGKFKLQDNQHGHETLSNAKPEAGIPSPAP